MRHTDATLHKIVQLARTHESYSSCSSSSSSSSRSSRLSYSSSLSSRYCWCRCHDCFVKHFHIGADILHHSGDRCDILLHSSYFSGKLNLIWNFVETQTFLALHESVESLL